MSKFTVSLNSSMPSSVYTYKVSQAIPVGTPIIMTTTSSGTMTVSFYDGVKYYMEYDGDILEIDFDSYDHYIKHPNNDLYQVWWEEE